MDFKKMAIIIPVYNVEDYVLDCLHSLKNQSSKNFIAIIVNDGSKDSSGRVAHNFSRKYSNFIFIDQENKGLSGARNAGLDYLESKKVDVEYVYFLDSDDYIDSKFVKDLTLFLDKSDADILCFGFDRFDRKGTYVDSLSNHQNKILDRDAFREFYLEPMGKSRVVAKFLGNKVFRWCAIRGVRFSLEMKGCEDQEFMLRVIEREKFNGALVVNDLMYHYRLRRSSLTRTVNPFKKLFFLYGNLAETVDNLNAQSLYLNEAFNCFWDALRRDCSSKKNNYEYYKECISQLFSNSRSELLSRRNRKRLAIFNLGKAVVILYFKLRKNIKVAKQESLFP